MTSWNMLNRYPVNILLMQFSQVYKIFVRKTLYSKSCWGWPGCILILQSGYSCCPTNLPVYSFVVCSQKSHPHSTLKKPFSVPMQQRNSSLTIPLHFPFAYPSAQFASHVRLYRLT